MVHPRLKSCTSSPKWALSASGREHGWASRGGCLVLLCQVSPGTQNPQNLGLSQWVLPVFIKLTETWFASSWLCHVTFWEVQNFLKFPSMILQKCLFGLTPHLRLLVSSFLLCQYNKSSQLPVSLPDIALKERQLIDHSRMNVLTFPPSNSLEVFTDIYWILQTSSLEHKMHRKKTMSSRTNSATCWSNTNSRTATQPQSCDPTLNPWPQLNTSYDSNLTHAPSLKLNPMTQPHVSTPTPWSQPQPLWPNPTQHWIQQEPNSNTNSMTPSPNSFQLHEDGDGRHLGWMFEIFNSTQFREPQHSRWVLTKKIQKSKISITIPQLQP